MTYIEALQKAIRDLHGCESFHVSTTPVTEMFAGKVVWDGEVETFGLLAHPSAAICYAWAYQDGGTWHHTAVLSTPPVNTPQDAVRAAIVAKVKNENKKA